MKPYIFKIPILNEHTINELYDIASNDLIIPKANINSFNVMFLSGLLIATVLSYSVLGMITPFGEIGFFSWLAFTMNFPIWICLLMFIIIFNFVNSTTQKQSVAGISAVVNLVCGFICLILIPHFIGLLCILLLSVIAFNFYQGTRSRMVQVLQKDPGPYNALIIDQNQNQLLLENLNNNQLCCVDDLCEMLKKLNKKYRE